jgi:hypothetical protein
VLGGDALRHQFDSDVGLIGYGVRPFARHRGLASWERRSGRPLPPWEWAGLSCPASGMTSPRPHGRPHRWRPGRHPRHRAWSGAALLDHLEIGEVASAQGGRWEPLSRAWTRTDWRGRRYRQRWFGVSASSVGLAKGVGGRARWSP